MPHVHRCIRAIGVELIRASAEGKGARRAIFALNFFLGWTVIGWVASLVWALTIDKDAPAVPRNPVIVPSAVASYIFSDGRYFLRLYGQSVRTLFITPNDPINGSQPMAPPPGYYWQNVEFAVACHDQSGNIVPLPNIVNATGNCIMILDFGYNGTEYKLAMGPNANLPSPAPLSGLVNVACNSVSNGVCVNWTITPNMTASSTNLPTVANLYIYTGSHRTALALVGQYYQTFRIDVTNP